MSKNISKLSGRIGLKDNLFQKISERSLNSKNGDGMKELAEKYPEHDFIIFGAFDFSSKDSINNSDFLNLCSKLLLRA